MQSAESGQPRGGKHAAPAASISIQCAVGAAGLPTLHAMRRFARAAVAQPLAVTIRLVGAREGARLNTAYRGKDGPTNVLTFVYDDTLPLSGDLVLCVPVLRREAKAQGKPLANHCAHLIVHGMLHLQGHDHDSAPAARRMEAREAAILATFGIPNPYL